MRAVDKDPASLPVCTPVTAACSANEKLGADMPPRAKTF